MAEVFLQWRDDYLIGVEELDFEHRDLFARLNELHEELAHDADRARIENGLGEICARVAAHFALEEKFMRDTDFPKYSHHKKEHDDFLEVIVDYAEEIGSTEDITKRDELESELQHWIIDHVTTSDQELGYPKERKAGFWKKVSKSLFTKDR